MYPVTCGSAIRSQPLTPPRRPPKCTGQRPSSYSAASGGCGRGEDAPLQGRAQEPNQEQRSLPSSAPHSYLSTRLWFLDLCVPSLWSASYWEIYVACIKSGDERLPAGVGQHEGVRGGHRLTAAQSSILIHLGWCQRLLCPIQTMGLLGSWMFQRREC